MAIYIGPRYTNVFRIKLCCAKNSFGNKYITCAYACAYLTVVILAVEYPVFDLIKKFIPAEKCSLHVFNIQN